MKLINLKDEKDVQIWCDYQEETRQTSANYFLRLRFANFRTFLANTNNYGLRNGYSNGYGWGDGIGDGYGSVDGDGGGSDLGKGNGNGYGGGDKSQHHD